MIVAVKRNKNLKYLKIAIGVVLTIFLAIFVYLKFATPKEEIKVETPIKEIAKEEIKDKEENKIDIEKAILSEVEKAVELVGQEYIRTVKILDNKIVIVCEPNSNLEALFVRYGAMAMVKKTLNETVIAVDINFILQSRLYEK